MISASTSFDPASAVIACRNSSAEACARSVTGLCTSAVDGTRPASAAFTSSCSSGTLSPRNSQESAHRTPGPPALVMIPTRLPAGSG